MSDLADPFPGEFRLVRELGRGAFGVVWLAEDLSPLRRNVALKFVRGTAGRGRLALDLLRHEARLLASFSHPHIVRVYAWRQPLGANFPCLVLQYVAGGSLKGRVERAGPLRWDIATRYTTDIAEGLAAMHARGVVHRDVKPDNLLHDPDNDEALLTDLGIAARLTDPASEGGTPYFTAPEGFDGVLSPALDVYSLAASLFWLVTGHHAFDGESRASLRRAIEAGLPTRDPRFAGVPTTLERHIRAGLRADANERPSLDVFAHDLRASLNLLMADRLAPPTSAVDLRLSVYRVTPSGVDVLLAATAGETEILPREGRTVPAIPDRVTLHTGDRVRVSVVADRPGYLVVFNVGPTGRLNLILPPTPNDRPMPPMDVELTPPAGRERLVALWTQNPLRLEARSEYEATRDLGRVEEMLERLPAEARQVVVLELDHRPGERGVYASRGQR